MIDINKLFTLIHLQPQKINITLTYTYILLSTKYLLFYKTAKKLITYFSVLLCFIVFTGHCQLVILVLFDRLFNKQIVKTYHNVKVTNKINVNKIW